MKELSRDQYVDPQDQGTKLGPVPLLFLRYLYFAEGTKKACTHSKLIFDFVTSAPLMAIEAESVQEIEYAHRELLRCEKFLSYENNKSSSGYSFRESVIFPSPLSESRESHRAPSVCAACGSIISQRPPPFCSRWKVTCYCSKECQTVHWKRGHKKVCRPASEKASTEYQTSGSSRLSFSFDIEDAKHPKEEDGMVQMMINHNTGRVTASVGKEDRAKIQSKGQKVHKQPNSRNAHGDEEFIVKLQPPTSVGLPTTPWMCYDGPLRSFQAWIDPNTSGLEQVYWLLKRDGVHAVNPIYGSSGYKGYLMARWEGSTIQAFYDRLVPPPAW